MQQRFPIPINSHDWPLRLCWVRENAPRRLEYGVEIALSLDAVPVALDHFNPELEPATLSALSESICAAARFKPGAEVHLPFIGRRDWKDRNRILGDTRFRSFGSQILPAECLRTPHHLNEFNARLAAAAAFQPDVDTSIQCPVPRGYVSSPAGTFHAWRIAPTEKQSTYFSAHRPASLAVQRALRQGLIMHFLRDLDYCTNMEDTCAVLAYAATALCHGTRTQFTYDVLKPKWFASAFHFAQKPLDAHLVRLRNVFYRAGRSDLLALYADVTAKEIIRTFRSRRQPVKRLMAHEERIMNVVFSAGTEIRNAKSARELMPALLAHFSALETRLRRFAFGTDYSEGASLVMMEATRALSDNLAMIEANSKAA